MKDLLRSNLIYFLLKRISLFDRQKIELFINNHYDGKEFDLSAIKRAMMMCYIFGGVRYSDFFQMRFEEKSLKEKMRFIPRSAEMNLYLQVNANKYVKILEDKGECYNTFQQYYKRRIVKVSEEEIGSRNTIDILSKFSDEYGRFMIKPLNLYCGYGIQILNAPLSDSEIRDIVENYKKGFVLEELICQNDKMAALHGNSVNTVRVITVNYGDAIEIKWPFLRVGRGDAVVDNAGSGGIIVAIDSKGIGYAAGDEHRNKFITHPETGVPLVGFELPKWEELCSVVKEMSSQCPDCHIMGWDMAYTKNEEWVVVECNYGPNIVSQYVTGQGIRDEFVKVRKRLGAKRFGRFYQ